MFEEEYSDLIARSNAGDSEASLKLGRNYFQKYEKWMYPEDGIEGDDIMSSEDIVEVVKQSIHYFELAIDQGNTKAIKELGDVYCCIYEDYYYSDSPIVTNASEGRSVFEKAIHYYELALEQGNDKVHFDLAYIYNCSFKSTDIIESFKHYYIYINKYDDKDFFIYQSNKGIYRGNGNGELLFSTHFDISRLYIDCFEIIISRQGDDEYKFRQGLGVELLEFTKSIGLQFIDYFEKKIENKNNWIKVACAIGEWYLKRKNKDVKKAIEWLKIGCDNNCAKSAEILGKYYCGLYESEEINDTEAEKYLELAVQLGNDGVAIFLASKYVSKNDISYKDKIISLLLSVGEKDIQAYYFLAKYYLSINEYELAFSYFKKGKKHDFSDCNIQIACLLKEGIGCEQDVDDAIDVLFEIIDYAQLSEAEDGTPNIYCPEMDDGEAFEVLGKAYAELGEIYYDEQYYHKNNKRAHKYLACGIKCGSGKAYYLLGKLILDGYQEAGTIEEGNMYIEQAKSLGFVPAPYQERSKKENASKILEEQIIFYQKQLIEKDKLIEKQQMQIDKITDRLINTVTETNEIVKRIDSKIDTLLDEVSTIKRENNESLNKIIANQEAYEQKITEVGNEIIEKVSNSVSLGDPTEYIRQYVLLFGKENWDKLLENSKRYLVTAKILFKTLSSTDNGDLDYSAVCLMICKTVENELKRRFYFEFVKYLKDRYGNNYSKYHSHLINTYFDKVTGEQRFGLKTENLICLGDIIYILCPTFIQAKFVGNYIASKEQIRNFANTTVFREEVDDKYIEHLCFEIKKIKDDYRNPSCHLNPVRLVTAAECFDYVINITQVLIAFLNACKL